MKKISLRTAIVFVFTLILCSFLVFIMSSNRSQVERLNLEQLISEKNARINDVLTNLLFRAQTLTTHIIYNDGHVEDFDHLAHMLVDNPNILNVLIAPDGVVTNVYPLEGNEAVLGLDFFSEGAGNAEAIRAKETRQIVLGGPFHAVQGWDVLVGRLPVFLPNDDGTDRFWGIVSITLRHPEALQAAGLYEFSVMGLNYELWRINPDTGEHQVVMGTQYDQRSNYLQKSLYLMHSHWYLRAFPVQSWYTFPETWLLFFAGLCMSFLAAVVMQSYLDLKKLKNNLEALSNSDPLTGIYNRRYFMETAAKQMLRVIRQDTESFIIMLDLDYFKTVNDKYGHQSGDIVLKEAAQRISGTLRPYDLFARYGGEEFIVYITEIDYEATMNLAERIRKNISGIPIKIKDGENTKDITITASLGVTLAAPTNKLEYSIDLADQALYKAKEEGRDRVVFISSL